MILTRNSPAQKYSCRPPLGGLGDGLGGSVNFMSKKDAVPFDLT
jgi:hypothetical protein